MVRVCALDMDEAGCIIIEILGMVPSSSVCEYPGMVRSSRLEIGSAQSKILIQILNNR